MKRFLGGLLVFCMMILAMPFSAFAAEDVVYPSVDATYAQVAEYLTSVVSKRMASIRNGESIDKVAVSFKFSSSETMYSGIGDSGNLYSGLFYRIFERIVAAYYGGVVSISNRVDMPSGKTSEHVYTFFFDNSRNPALAEKLKAIAANAKAFSTTPSGQLEYINKYLIDHVVYGTEDVNEFYSKPGWTSSPHQAANTTEYAIMNGLAVCGGYTNAVSDLCFLLGIPNVILYGHNSKANEDHSWNCVYVDNAWKMLDVTWNDTGGSSKKYFLVDSINDDTHNYEKYDDIKIVNAAKSLALALYSTAPVTPPAPTLTANATASSVLVDGKSVSFDAYNIEGNNYFKLRDLAFVLSGSQKQFEVTWDAANNAIGLISGAPYTPAGGEMAAKGTGAKAAAPSASAIYLDGKAVILTAYTIEGNNYFKLRDLGAAFDFEVDWDGARNTIVIDTSLGYTPD
jgi:Uncharacterized protein involved in cytokinesis, contains TGc (transglutaminase/protease-like) domain